MISFLKRLKILVALDLLRAMVLHVLAQLMAGMELKFHLVIMADVVATDV